MKIMLLDDEEEILTSLARALRLMGHDVDCYSTAAAAVTAYEQGHYDFALVDYLMPQANGVWFMKQIKDKRKTKILLMTAFTNRTVIAEMLRLGAAGYMIKPFDEEEIQMHLSFHSGEGASSKASVPL